MVVVHKGRLIAERYCAGITKDTQLESWSMGKSITSTLFALLVKDGTYTLEQRAPVPEWQAPGDPRGAIRNIDLLRMSSGLRFIATQDSDYSPDKGYPDHFYIYTGAVNAFDYSVNVPLQFPVNTEGRYRNCDPLTIGRLVKQAVTKRGEEYLTWPQRALFDRIGIRRQVLETDPYGNFLLTGYDYGTPRNWARLGLLYLQDGMWQGTRLLPEGWAKFVSTPAPAWKTADVWRAVLDQRHRPVEPAARRLLHGRRGRAMDVRHPVPPARRRAHGPLQGRGRRAARAQRGVYATAGRDQIGPDLERSRRA